MEAIDRPLGELISVMDDQVRGMDAFQATQGEVGDALGAKDWPTLDRALRNLDTQAEALRALEERRHALWTTVQHRLLGRTGRVYETLALVPEPHRARLTRLHRDLKVRAVNLKGMTQGLASFVQTTGAVIQAVVHEIQPSLKGRLYSRNGFIRGGQTQPLVLNAQF